MRIRFVAAVLATVGLLFVPVSPMAQSSDEVLIRQAVELEKAKGDVKGAIALYERLAKSSNPKTVAVARAELARLTQPPVPSGSARPERFRSEIVTREGAADGLTLLRALPGGDTVAVRQTGSDQRRQVSLVVVEARSGKERELTRLAALPRELDMEVSPDGAYVAVIDGVRGDGAPPETLVVVNTRGPASPTVLILGLGSPSQSYRYRPLLQWSPDSQWLPFVAPGADGLAEFKLLRVSTKAVRSLGVHGDGPPDFRWSPSGLEIALRLTHSAKQVDELAIVTIATNAVRRIPVPAVPESTGVRTRLAAWTTKGGLLVQASPTFVMTSDHWLVNPEDGRARRICSGGPIQVGMISPRSDNSFRINTWDDCLSLSRDGLLQLVWLRQSKRLVLRDTSSDRDRNLSLGSGEEHAGHLSPDDRVVIFASNRDGFWGLYAALVDQAPTPNPALLLRMDGLPAGLTIDWATDGMRARISYYETNIHRVPMDKATGRSTGGLERLTQNVSANRAPSFSADGRRIAYWSSGTRSGLTVMDGDGANERQVTEHQFFQWHPAPIWTSDSEVLARAYRAERSSPFTHQFVDLRTGGSRDAAVPRPVFPEALDYVSASGLAWIPASREFVYIERESGSLGQIMRARSQADGHERVLAAFPDGGVNAFAISTTGGQVAFSRFSKDEKCPCEIGVINTETGQRRVFETSPNPQVPVAWSPDGRFLLYGAARPRIMDVAAGKSWTLMDPAAQPTWLQEGSWSPDGTAIVLTVSSNRFETRRWEDLAPATITRAIQAGGAR